MISSYGEAQIQSNLTLYNQLLNLAAKLLRITKHLRAPLKFPILIGNWEDPKQPKGV